MTPQQREARMMPPLEGNNDYKCIICHEWYRMNQGRSTHVQQNCAVVHPAGQCCHYGEEHLVNVNGQESKMTEQLDGLAYTPEDLDFTDIAEQERQLIFDDGFGEGYDAGVDVTRSVDASAIKSQKAAIRDLHLQVARTKKKLKLMKEAKDKVDKRLCEARAEIAGCMECQKDGGGA